MFKNTNDFFEQVYNGEVSDIDTTNFVYVLTEDDQYRLLLLKKDILFFINSKREELESKITKEALNNKLKYYYEKGHEPPRKTWINHISKKLNKKNGNKILEEVSTTLDFEKMFYPHELFCIRRLEKYIDSLINKEDNQKLKQEKHENIFSNNGFVLFEHVLKEYVKTKRGRLSDIHFFYWSMFNNKPQYIHQRPERFKEWFFENYNNEDLGKIKTLNEVSNPDRLKHYSNALDWFKTQK